MKKEQLNLSVEDIRNSLTSLSDELLMVSDKHVYTVILINDINIALKKIKEEIERIGE